MLRPRETGGERDLASFWRGVGERRGGEVVFSSFATYRGRAGCGPEDLAGLLYRVGDRFWFEDFERESWLLRVLPPRRPFAKTEVSFDRGAVTSARVVARAAANRCLRGAASPGDAAPLGRAGRLFSTPVVQVSLADGGTLYFEVMRERELLAELAASGTPGRPAR